MPQIRPRIAVPRTVLMCRPDHFTVSYRINPWMRPEEPTDTARAVRQWEELYRTYVRLGYDVRLIDPVAGPAGHGLRRERRVRSSTASRTARASGTPSAPRRARST